MLPQHFVFEPRCLVGRPPHISPVGSSLPLSYLADLPLTTPLQTQAQASATIRSQELTPPISDLSPRFHRDCNVPPVRGRKCEHRAASGTAGRSRNARKLLHSDRSRSLIGTEPRLSVSVQPRALPAISTSAPESALSSSSTKPTRTPRPLTSPEKSQSESDLMQRTKPCSDIVAKKSKRTKSQLTELFTTGGEKDISSDSLKRILCDCEDPIDSRTGHEIERAEALLVPVPKTSMVPQVPVPKTSVPRKRLKISKVSSSSDEPAKQFPAVCTDFSGVPEDYVGDMLQIWDFMTAFGKILRITSCGLLTFERALSSASQEPIIDALLIRLVYTIVSDKQLVEDMAIEPDLVMSLLSIKSSRRRSAIKEILYALPSILRVEMDASDYHDGKLLDVVNVLVSSEEIFAFYLCIDSAGRVLILRQLVELACGADALRECVFDSLEHAAEERKKARENIIVGRRKIETQLKDLRDELEAYKHRHNLEITSIDGGPTVTESITNPSGGQSRSLSGSDGVSEGARPQSHKLFAAKTSRKEKLETGRRIRQLEQERRTVERGAEVLEAKIDKLKSTLKAMKTARLHLSREPSKSNVSKSAQFVPGKDPAPSDSISRAHLDFDCDPVRTYALGHDRKHRSYWFFPDVGRLWIESTSLQSWCYLNDKLELNKLLDWLSPARQAEARLVTELTKVMPAIEAAIAKSARVQSSSPAVDGQDLVEYTDLKRNAGKSGGDAGDVTATMATKNSMRMKFATQARSSSLSSVSSKVDVEVQAVSGRKSRTFASRRKLAAVTNDRQSEGDRGVLLEDHSVPHASSFKHRASILPRRSVRRVLATANDPEPRNEPDHLARSRTSSRAPRKDAKTDTCSANVDIDCRRSVRLSRAVSLKRSANAMALGGEVATDRRTRARSLTAMT